MKLLLFLTNDLICVFGAIKVSQSEFILNSFALSFNCSGLPIGEVGINLRPLFNKNISAKLNCLLDKFLIFIVF